MSAPNIDREAKEVLLADMASEIRRCVLSTTKFDRNNVYWRGDPYDYLYSVSCHIEYKKLVILFFYTRIQ